MRANVHTTPNLRLERDLLGFKRFVPVEPAPSVRREPTAEEVEAVRQAAAALAEEVAARQAAPTKAPTAVPLGDEALVAHYRAIIGAEQSACDAWRAYDAELAAWRADGSVGRQPATPFLPRPSARASAAAARIAAIESRWGAP